MRIEKCFVENIHVKEIECKRNNVTPRQFFRYCKQKCFRKGLEIENWISFQEWAEPTKEQQWHVRVHNNNGIKILEVIEFMPYSCHLVLQNSYNFIIEFEFDYKKKGHGYFYVLETDE